MQHLQHNTTLQGGKYRIERVLGQGGFGITYLAIHAHLGLQVAIKEFFIKGVNERDEGRTTVSVSNSDNRALFEEQLEKFCKEARRLNSLNNEHIVKVHDLFGENGTWYYVMEMIDGESLSDRLKRMKRPLSEKEMDSVLPQILDALKEIHQNGMWHLDIKPSNIMIDKNNVVKLIDFGASKQIDPETGGPTTGTQFAFTPGYAPGELEGNDKSRIGDPTDLYSLGATTYKLLTNIDPPKPYRIINDGEGAFDFTHVSNRYKALILWMMQQRIDKRPASVQTILEFIGKGEDSSPVQTPEPSNENSEVTVIEEHHEPELSPKKASSQGPVRETDGRKDEEETPRGGGQKMIGIIVAIGLAFILGGYYLYRDTPYYKSNYSDNDTIVGPDTDSICSDSILFESAMLDKEELIKNLINDMVYVQGGEYKKGYAKDFKKYDRDDLLGYCIPYSPVNTRVSSFYICKYETTQDIWKSIMGTNPSRIYRGAKKPVVNVSWNLCNDFIKKLNNLSGKRFRLPTEAEWEFAAIGGRKNSHFVFSGSNQLDLVACRNKLEIVGSKVPNELGLFDMSGNAVEWCNDVSRFRLGDNSTPCRVLKGGSYRSGDEWMFLPQYFDFWNENEALEDFGFRLVLDDL